MLCESVLNDSTIAAENYYDAAHEYQIADPDRSESGSEFWQQVPKG